MRLLFSCLILSGLSGILRADDQLRPASAGETALFQAAMHNATQDTEHWAYTETTVMKTGKDGRQDRGATVVRFDPSKPYAEQFTPLLVEGKPPTERQLRKYRERGEKRGEKVARAAADPAAAAKPAPGVRINGSRMTLDLENPRVAHDETERIIFEVPLAGPDRDIPVDKFQVRVVVRKPTRQLEHATLRLREAFRVKLVAKIKAGEASMDFAVVDPKFGPVMTAVTGNIGASVLFFPVHAVFSNTRTEWRRVKPYNDRLRVKLGPLEVLDF